ncbi:MAG: MFS transporter [Chloroflexi bacterium]|nr:MFS transporter [Chloroflexota bacterium]
MTNNVHSPDQKPTLPVEFWVALVGVSLFAMGLTILLPIVPLYITDHLDAPRQWIGTATLAVAFTAVSTRIPGGALSDNLGRRRIMLIGALLGLVGTALYLVSWNVAIFLIARTMSGISLGLYTTANKALIADLAPPTRRGEAMGLSNSAFSLALIISPLLGEGIKNAISFQAVFALNGVLTFGALIITLALPKTRPVRDAGRSTRLDISDTLHERGSWAAIILMLGLGSVLALMFSLYPQIAEDKDLFADSPGFLSAVAMSLGISIWATVDTLIEPVAGRVSDRLGRQPVVAPGLVITVIGVFMLSQAATTLATYLAVAVMAAGWGIARAVADSMAQDAVAPMVRGMGAAILYTGFDIAVGANAQGLVFLIDGTDFSNLFLAVIVLVAVFGAAGTLLSSRLLPYEQRELARQPASAD